MERTNTNVAGWLFAFEFNYLFGGSECAIVMSIIFID